ncbi:hypothetical protein MA9V1_123 [Chryseobacterium phage MA9V-1]|nr:hypothetical protein MA9V1_123 [Chryseobacterium phage MA9V-1]
MTTINNFKVGDLVKIKVHNEILAEDSSKNAYINPIYKIEFGKAFFITHREMAVVNLTDLEMAEFPYINTHGNDGYLIIDSRLTNDVRTYSAIFNIKGRHAVDVFYNEKTKLYNVKWSKNSKGKFYTHEELLAFA